MNRKRQEHITEDEFISFVLEDLPEALGEEIDQHIVACVDCARQLDDYYTACEQFPAKKWDKQRSAFVAELRRRVFGPESAKERLRAFLDSLAASRFVVSFQPGMFDTRSSRELESKDGICGLVIDEEDNGDLSISIGSKETELDNTVVRFTAGDWSKEVVLKKLAGDTVGAEFFITCEERRQLDKVAVLDAEIETGRS